MWIDRAASFWRQVLDEIISPAFAGSLRFFFRNIYVILKLSFYFTKINVSTYLKNNLVMIFDSGCLQKED
ncbi:hypothetical protein HMPREF0556_11495 [Listeria grayi DSM 20601]|uniref:Uncharacterized protein n=1 Tax=Listeria grayi DSM 20601 TaxID=525367 RepID=D7UYC0_LISGR|nr:hypothetical protein HMPREF0556_11495 [Listeria grayi DSM 20601]